jgi:plasmid replication initiation protein
MKNETVVKHNSLINASFNLDLTEQRLILLAIVKARSTGLGITSDSKLLIHANDYAEQFSVEKHTSYTVLKDAVNSLFERQFSFKDSDGGIVRSRWVSRIKYKDASAVVEIVFSPDVVPLITKLEKHFTSYKLDQVAQLTSKYAIRLYEILIAWKSTGTTPALDLAELRYRLGLTDNEYTTMSNFKTRVIDLAVNQINQFTDITATYEQHKQGRTITGFTFKLKPKTTPAPAPTQCANTISLFSNLNNKQAKLFSSKLAADPALSDLAAVGESTADFANRLEVMLLDLDNQKPKTQSRLREALKNAGFSA